jgi:undecaprenyl diphosphate synthase
MSSDEGFGLDELKARVEGIRLPRHIAIIMDGNGRWAKQRGLPRVVGHFEGRNSTKCIIKACEALGVEALSLYAFSAENWQRPAEEVEALLGLIGAAMAEETQELVEANIRLRASGRMRELPEELQGIFRDAEQATSGCTGMVLNICVNYGGRAEIVDAARALAARVKTGDLSPEELDDAALTACLYQPDLPDPDMLLRPGGEMRVSNFLLWEIAYAEIIVVPVLWPDFREEQLAEALLEYNHRQRRFGGVAESGGDV